jgi:hypothetical protein
VLRSEWLISYVSEEHLLSSYRRVKKVSEPALVSHPQPPTHSQAPTPHIVMHSGPGGRRRESTHEEPIWVIQLKSEGHSFHEMQQKTGVAKLQFIALSMTRTKSSMYGLCGKYASEK